MSRTVKAHILLILVTLVWGATFVVIKDALRDISPLLFNAVRLSLAAIALVLIYMGQLRRMTWGAFKSGVLIGTFLWLGYEFQTTGLKFTTASKSGFLTGVSVVLVPLFLALFWRKKFGMWTWAGVAMAFVGLFLLTVPAGDASSGFNLTGVNKGDVLSLGCAVAFGFQIILMGRATRVHPFEQIATLQAATAAVLMIATVPLIEHVYVVWTARVLWAIAITGLLGSAAAFTIQAWAQQFTSPTYTALIFALEPVFAWLTSYVVLRERLGYRGGLGAVLILLGIVVAEVKGGSDAGSGVAEPAG